MATIAAGPDARVHLSTGQRRKNVKADITGPARGRLCSTEMIRLATVRKADNRNYAGCDFGMENL